MSVDTHTKGRNLANYQKVRHPEHKIYVSPVLYGLVSRMVVTTKGRFIKRFAVELTGDVPTAEDCCDSG